MLHLSLLLALATAPLPNGEAERDWHRAVGLLQYLEGDYAAAVASGDAVELEEQRTFAKEAVVAIEALGPRGAAFLERARAIASAIERGEASDRLPADCGALARELLQTSGLSQAPRRVPDLKHGAAVYTANCQTCHGANGDGDTVVGKALKPPSANFHDLERMSQLTAYKAFNTTTFGVLGTGMPPFPSLTDDERWAVAFYLFTFRQPKCDGAAPSASLDALATQTDVQLAQTFGQSAVACLRRAPPAVTHGDALARAREGVERAQAAWKDGRATVARQELIDAYLEGLEPIEPLLRVRNPKAVNELEAAFADARRATQTGTGFELAAAHLLAVISRAQDPGAGATASFWSVFLTAALILLREGFEAMVVVAALLAVLKKLGATGHARTVHAGWVSALVVGGALYFFGQHLLAGAQREMLETYVAFAAVGMLLYAALWLNGRANISQHMGELRGKMQAALTRQSAVGLFAISFSAVLRETAETALFLQGLAVDSKQGTAWGAVAGLLALAAFVAFVSRAGFRLPMKALFTASTVLLVATAVVLLGKGMHGLQELGSLTLAPIFMLDVPMLGLFPDAWPTLAQALLLGAIAAFAWLKRVRMLPTVAAEQK